VPAEPRVRVESTAYSGVHKGHHGVAVPRRLGAAGDWLVWASPPVGEWIRVLFELVEREEVLRWPGRRQQIRARFRGDECVAMERPAGSRLAFFPEL
jgi:hypothetical protein